MTMEEAPINCTTCGRELSMQELDTCTDCLDLQEPPPERRQTVTTPRYQTKPTVHLIGENGNAFAILGACRKAAKRAGWTDEEWERVRAKMSSGDYDHLLATALEHFEIL